MWILLAVFSAIFAGLTSILAKCGIRQTDSDVATFLRTIVVLIFAWLMVFIVGSAHTIGDISFRSMVFLILSGLATGASWLCYFKALSLGDVNKVVPIDKSSTVLTVLFAIVILGETQSLVVQLGGVVLILMGTLMMIERKESHGDQQEGKRWLLYAVLSAVFAALTAILAKIGIDGVESNLATAIRTGVVLIMAFLILVIKGKQREIVSTNRKELVFIILSGIATGASWLCYYRAIQMGIVSIVVPIDKLSILVSIAFSRIVFKETLTPRGRWGLLLIVVGTLLMAIFVH
ncbi:MAG TPA: EamA family transporter [Firmicutes bacterium]|nr:EamA family transporter [Bacillota bacterium]